MCTSDATLGWDGGTLLTLSEGMCTYGSALNTYQAAGMHPTFPPSQDRMTVACMPPQTRSSHKVTQPDEPVPQSLLMSLACSGACQ